MFRRCQRSLLAVPFVNQAAFINGQFVAESKGDAVHTVVNPFDGKAIGTVPKCSDAQAEEAIAAAAGAQKAWAKTYPRFRKQALMRMADLMVANSDQLAKILSLESGKPLFEAKAEMLVSAQNLEWYASEAERTYGEVIPPFRGGVRPITTRKPVGVVGVITPWNFPSSMITRSMGGAIAAGCTVVLKPSELTPFSALALAQISKEAGLPDGVFNVLTGDHERGVAIGKVITGSSVVRKLCFTGSTRAGKMLMRDCVDTVKHISMELGGNAPLIVFDDADVDMAVEGTVAAKFRNAGQTCICANRIYAQAAVHDQYVEKLAKKVSELKLGHALDEGVTMGPVVSRQSAQRLKEMCRTLKADGADLVLGGESAEIPTLTQEQADEGRYVAPTIFSNVSQKAALDCGEIFGPVVPVVKFNTTEEVITLANDVNVGLASYFFTSDYKKQWTVAEQLETGMVGINEGSISTPVCPFGGVKESGLGRQGGKHGIDSFLDTCYHLHGGNIQ